VNLLPDTHILLWWLAGDRRLPRRAAELLDSGGNAVTVSVISLWEIAIKTAKSKIRADLNEIQAAIEQSEFMLLPVHGRHVIAYSQLPRYHRDPFDRMLVAQALSEPLRLLTHDHQLARYSDTVMVV